MNLLFAGGYDTQNLGDYASIKGLKKVLEKEGIAPDFTVLSRHPSDGFGQEIGVNTLLNLDHEDKEASLGRIFRGFNEQDSRDHLGNIFRALEASDALVLGNGRLFVDIALGFYSGPMPYFALLVSLARFIGKPVIIYSMSLVEPRTELGRQHLRFLLSNADLIILREESSRMVAANYLADMAKVAVLPDVAFALDQSDAESEESLPPFFKQTGSPTIALNFRSVSFDRTESEEFYRETADAVRQWLKKFRDRRLIMIPQVTYNIDTPDTDDRVANQRIFVHLTEDEQARVHVLSERLTLSRMLALYRSVDGVYSARRHGFIMSLTQGTPAKLFCREKNSEYLKDVLPFEELYLTESQLAEKSFGNEPNAMWSSVEQLRAKTGGYATLFASLLNS